MGPTSLYRIAKKVMIDSLSVSNLHIPAGQSDTEKSGQAFRADSTDMGQGRRSSRSRLEWDRNVHFR